jgi:hypothetical protein
MTGTVPIPWAAGEICRGPPITSNAVVFAMANARIGRIPNNYLAYRN